MPFDATMRAVPTGWSQHHQGTAEGGMNAQVTIGTRGTNVYDPATDTTTVTWSQEYAGPARVQSFMRAQLHVLAGQQITGRPYLVQVKANAARIETGMRVHVTTAVNDAQLVGEDLWVIDAQYGSERFTRDLICSDNESDIPAGP